MIHHIYPPIVAFGLIGLSIATITLKSSDGSSRMASSPGSQSYRIRSIVFSAVFIFSVMQLKELRVLMFSTYTDAGLDANNQAWAGWTPEDFRLPKKQRTTSKLREMTMPEPIAASSDADETNSKRIVEMASHNQKRRRKHKVKPERSEDHKEEAKKKRRKQKQAKGRKHNNKTREINPQRYSLSNYNDDFEPLPWTLPQPTPLRYKSSEQFMKEYIALKRRHKIPLPWEHKHDIYANKTVSLPLPIISLNFPKSATLTMKTYFNCGGITSIHTSTQDGRIAVCMMENQLNDRPPLHGCDTHKSRKEHNRGDIVPIDFISDIGLQGPPCYYASVHDGGLENIARHYPNSTILLVTRNSTSWARSIAKWGSMNSRLKKYCGFDGSVFDDDNSRYWSELYESNEVSKVYVSDTSYRTTRMDYWANFYEAHTQKIREFALKHLSLTYVEVELEDPRMGELLEGYTKVSKDCVMDCHPGPKWVRENNATSRCHPVGQNPMMVSANVNEVDDSDDSEEGEDESSENNDDDDVSDGEEESGDETEKEDNASDKVKE